MTLLFDAFDAYLAPLLKKHQAGQHLVWEDMEASRTASTKVLQLSENIFVSKRVDNLHLSQVKAYKEAGLKALQDWAQSLPLEPMEDSDTKESFVKRCILASSKSQPPNWKVIENPKQISMDEIQKRAAETYEKYRPEGTDGEVEPSEGEGETEGEPSEEGEADTEEEMDTADQKTAENAFTPKIKNKLKNKPRNKVPRKKGNGAKGGMRKPFAGNRRGKKNTGGNNKSG